MYSHLLFLCIISLFFSCSITGQVNNNRKCHTHIKEILKDKGWKYDDELGYYVREKDLIILVSNDNRECFKTLNKAQIIKLFGKPSKINEELKRFEYYLSPPCGNYCEFLNFIFNENNKVEKIRLGGGSKSH